MKPIQRAIVFLQQARDIIEDDAHWRDPVTDASTKEDLNDIAEDLGTALHHLESIEPPL